jgi:hypothetical protein
MHAHQRSTSCMHQYMQIVPPAAPGWPEAQRAHAAGQTQPGHEQQGSARLARTQQPCMQHQPTASGSGCYKPSNKCRPGGPCDKLCAGGVACNMTKHHATKHSSCMSHRNAAERCASTGLCTVSTAAPLSASRNAPAAECSDSLADASGPSTHAIAPAA